jgi:hypothetical protein
MLIKSATELSVDQFMIIPYRKKDANIENQCGVNNPAGELLNKHTRTILSIHPKQRHGRAVTAALSARALV